MTVAALENLTEEERELVLNTPSLVSVLISGADSDFDKDEERQAAKIIHLRTVEGDELLFDYYKAVEHSFVSSLHHLEQKYDGDAETRAQNVTTILSQLNDILPKLDARYARALVQDWKSLAKAVAKASGGILGFASISLEESHFIDLKMIKFEG